MTPPLNNKPDQIGDISLDFDTIITTASVTQKLLSKKKKKPSVTLLITVPLCEPLTKVFLLHKFHPRIAVLENQRELS